MLEENKDQQDQPDEAIASEGQDNGQAEAQEPTPKTFTQADIDEIITKRLERERSKAQKAAEEAKRKADEVAMEQRQEWEQLAKQREAQLSELEAKATEADETLKTTSEKYDALKESVSAYVEAQLANVPEATQQLLNKLPLKDRIEWLATNAKDIKRQVHPVPETPKPQLGDKADRESLRRNSSFNYKRKF